jgi:DNA invertase Pin-like site-specific DNA recombinase
MLIGYMRASKADESKISDLQRKALLRSGVLSEHIYEDFTSGINDKRRGLTTCLKALRRGDTLVVWKLDRLGRNLQHLVETVHDLSGKGIDFKVLTGQGAKIDTRTTQGVLIFEIFYALSAFERDFLSEKAMEELASARAHGRKGGMSYKMTQEKLILASSAMKKPETKINILCKEIGITRQTLYRYIAPDGSLRESGEKLLKEN